MTTATHSQPHPVTRAIGGAHASLTGVVGVPVWSMSAAETEGALVELGRLRATAAELEARLIRQAEAVDVAGEKGATSTANWLAHEVRIPRREASARAWLAAELENRPLLRLALAGGRVTPEQARVIARAVAELPDDLEADLAARAEERLVELAAVHDPRELRVLGRRILEVVAPQVADAHEARLLEAEERAAARTATLAMRDDGHGRTCGWFTIPTRHGAMLRKALLAIAAPKHQAAAGTPKPESRRPSSERLGQALCEYVESYPADGLPKTGGVNATVVVTMTFDALMGGLKAAELDTGQRISAGEARRLACTAKVIPAVLGGAGEVLDLGRARRLHSRAQRVAMGLRDGGCTVEGCDAPPALCHAHHDHPWSQGGPTNLDNGRLLCPRHHAYAHDHRFVLENRPHGKVRFHRRE